MLTTKKTFEPNTMVVPAPLFAVPSKAGQAGKGVARKIGRYLAEPAFIAGCGLAGALYAAQYDTLPGDAPVIGMAALAAGSATLMGTARFLVRAYRTSTYALGGFALRIAALLLCVAIHLHDLSCWCDDVSMRTYQGMMKFESE